MGLFSSIGKIFGGGGGGSSASTTNKTEVNVEPVTNVTVETEDIANAIKQGAELEAQIEAQAIKEEKAIKLQELQQDQEQTSKRNYQVLALLVLLGIAGYTYKKGGSS